MGGQAHRLVVAEHGERVAHASLRMMRLPGARTGGTPPSRDVEGYAWLVTGDLLPGWYDDWLLLEQERVRQLRLHALEQSDQPLRLPAAGDIQWAVPDIDVSALASQLAGRVRTGPGV